MESELDYAKYILSEKDICLMYEQRMLQFSIDVTINKVEFRSKKMNYFEFYGIQHINNGHRNAFTFPEVVKK